MGAYHELSGNYWGDLGATPGFREIWVFGVVSGDLGPQKAFAQIRTVCNGAGPI